MATCSIAFWNHWQFWGRFPLSCLCVRFSSSLHENLFLIPPKVILWPYCHQHFWLLSLVLSVGSELNWIRINTVTNSLWIVSKIFLSFLSSFFLRLLLFKLQTSEKKIMRSYTGNRTEYLLAWIPVNCGNFTSMCGSVLYCSHIQKSSSS